ncbi:MAG TPA: hypothetical protein VMN57_13885 [Anaerolineales bacterium]|nr:hypothetical protein [Anaerolineales bacterium]
MFPDDRLSTVLFKRFLGLAIACLGLSLACSAPVFVPTAVPLPSPSPTWTLLSPATPTPQPSATPEPLPTLSPGPSPSPSPTGMEPVFSCPSAPVPRVAVGDTARVTFTDGLPLRIRSSPEVRNDNVVTQITEGATFTILGGPVCTAIPGSEGAYVFWEIELDTSGVSGWVAEGDDSAYYIEEVP